MDYQKWYMRQYYSNNKEKMQEYKKKYYQEHYYEYSLHQKERYSKSEKCRSCVFLYGPPLFKMYDYTNSYLYACGNENKKGSKRKTGSTIACKLWEGKKDENQD